MVLDKEKYDEGHCDRLEVGFLQLHGKLDGINNIKGAIKHWHPTISMDLISTEKENFFSENRMFHD